MNIYPQSIERIIARKRQDGIKIITCYKTTKFKTVTVELLFFFFKLKRLEIKVRNLQGRKKGRIRNIKNKNIRDIAYDDATVSARKKR